MNARAKITIPDRFYEKSDLWGLRASVRLLGVPLIWIVLIPFLYQISPWLAVAVIAPLGIAISKTTILVHEAIHGTLFRTPALNLIVGRLAGWWTVVDFAAFQALHRQHHGHVGDDDDPQLLDYGDLSQANRRTLAWHLFRPLIGWNLRHMLTLAGQRLRMQNSRPVVLGELAGLAAVQFTFFLLATAGGSHLWLGLIFPVAAATVGLFMSQLRGFCEHVPMPNEPAEMRLRSHTSNPLERPFLHYLNYNFHGEHHLYPRIPSRNLPALARWLGERGHAVERSPSYLATLLARWEAAK
jgi:fatty acid desaturase